ncbi:MAG: cation:proton antiporter [Burkholderiales bacterium]|jgi:CPA2 family monovalent cation:H+ antiporter-2|uniref:cation:proton antiporter domain-containing protein n=1 Tax=Limnobacter sp. TaxID=2003368 RepID=UPI0039BD250E|nr:cation:proton antiporter [Burkholderiales bacterium]
MPHDVSLIATLAFGFGLALIFGFIAEKLKAPALLGYLVAGFLIGPATPGFVADPALTNQLAEVGVMLLMFGVGMHFSLNDLLAVKKIAVPGAIVQMTAATLLGMGVAHFWDWPMGQSLVFGLALSVASTVVLLKALEARGMLTSANGQIAVGWLVVEDLAMVLILVLLPPLAGLLKGGALDPDTNLFFDIGFTLVKVALFVGLMLVVGKRVIPWMLWHIAKTGSRELFTLSVIALAISLAFVAAGLFDVSFALGAFFAGMVMRESELSHRAAEESLPLRDAFAVLFFVSVGMLFQFGVILEHPLRVLAVVAIIVLGKSLAAGALVLLFKYPLKSALVIAASLAQIGEFSFILIGLGLYLGLVDLQVQSLVVSGAILSIALNPVVFSLIPKLNDLMVKRFQWVRNLNARSHVMEELPQQTDSKYLGKHVVLVGHTELSKRIAKSLRQKNVPLVIVDTSREVVAKLRKNGQAAVSGEYADPVTLVQAHTANANSLVIATGDTPGLMQMIENAKMLNPAIQVFVQAYSKEEKEMLSTLADVHVYRWEDTLSDAMVHDLMKTRPAM